MAFNCNFYNDVAGAVVSSSIKTSKTETDSISCKGSVSSDSLSTSTVSAGTVQTDRITAKNAGDPIILNGEVIITN